MNQKLKKALAYAIIPVSIGLIWGAVEFGEYKRQKAVEQQKLEEVVFDNMLNIGTIWNENYVPLRVVKTGERCTLSYTDAVGKEVVIGTYECNKPRQIYSASSTSTDISKGIK